MHVCMDMFIHVNMETYKYAYIDLWYKSKAKSEWFIFIYSSSHIVNVSGNESGTGGGFGQLVTSRFNS